VRHDFKTVSYGVIAFVTSPDETRFLITKKRNTYEYISIIRGHWRDLTHLKKLYSECSKNEQTLLLTKQFDVLWSDLWIRPPSTGCLKGELTPSEVRVAMAKFRKRFFQLQALRPKLKEVTTHGNCLWEFPKGRKDTPSESELECALREFQEETNIPSRHLTPPIRAQVAEEHRGSDKMFYKTVYFVLSIDRVVIPSNSVRTPLRVTLSEEAKVLRWATLEECKTLVVNGEYRSVFAVLQKI
jgi:8-oxo-dGTP pyrophosphatase MutT (NUDIX family)